MAMLAGSAAEVVTPTDRDSRVARESGVALAALLSRNGSGSDVHVRVCTDGDTDAEIRLPAQMLRLLVGALHEMGEGNGVALVPIRTELTTQQAADLLQVSRPYFIKLLEAGRIPYRRVGTHRRVLRGDILRYAQEERLRREQVMDELAAETDRLGL